MRLTSAMFGFLFFVYFLECRAGGPFNIEIHQINIQVSKERLDLLHANPRNNDLTADCSVTLLGKTYPGKLEIRGDLARSFVKKSYGVKFAKESAPKVNLFNYFGDKEEKLRKLLLMGSWVDGTFIRNKLTYDLARELGAVSSRVVFTELSFNGQYNGLYFIVEQVGDEMFDKLNWNDKNANLYKAATHRADFTTTTTIGYEKKNNEKVDPSMKDLQDVLVALHTLPRNFGTFQRSFQPLFHIPDWMLYSFVNIYGNNGDSFSKNYFLYHDQTIQSPFRTIVWDNDATWGNNWNGLPIGASPRLIAHDGLSQALFNIPEYRFSYLTNLKCLIQNGPFQTSRILAKVNAMAEALAPYMVREEARWPDRIDKRSYSDKVQALRNFVVSRGSTFLPLVEAGIAQVSHVGRDLVVGANGKPYFTCGVAPNPAIIKSPKPDAPKPDVPKPDVPKPDVPKPDVPKPDVPEPDVPTPIVFPPSWGSQPPISKPPSDISQPPSGGSNPPSWGYKPPGGNNPPSWPPSGGYKVPSGGHKPPSGGHKRPSGGHKRPSGGHKPPVYKAPHVPYKAPHVPYKAPRVPYKAPHVAYKAPHVGGNKAPRGGGYKTTHGGKKGRHYALSDVNSARQPDSAQTNSAPSLSSSTISVVVVCVVAVVAIIIVVVLLVLRQKKTTEAKQFNP